MRFDARKVLGGFGLLVVSTAAVLSLFEFLVVPRFVVPRGVDRNLALMGFYAPPGVRIDDTLVNSQGFTGSELSEPDGSPRSTRILTLGGSAMFNRRMTERMIAAWRDVFPTPTEVVGAALRTHTTRANVIKYEYHFSKYRFDYVLFYEGVNDLWANNVEPRRFSWDYSHQNPWGHRNLLLDNVMLARLVYNYLNPGRGKLPGAASNQANFMAEMSFESNLRTLVASIRAHGGKPVLMTFAWYIPENYSLDLFSAGALDYNNPMRYDYCPAELGGDVAYVRSGLQRNNAIIRRLAAELDVDLIEQDESLRDDPRNFGDPVHLSEIGTDRFIANLTRYFRRESGALPPRSP